MITSTHFGRSFQRLSLNIATVALAVIFALPFYWTLRYALADRGAPLWRLFHQQPIGTWLINSLFLASAYCVLVVLICSLAGFALARYQFAGRRLAVGIMLLTVLIPPAVLMPGGFELVTWLGWVNSFPAALVPGLANVLAVMLFMQAMRGIPDDLLHAARLDGCGEYRLWWSIALPMVRPMTGALTLMSFLGSWNAFLWPQIVLIDNTKQTLPIGLANLSGLPQDQINLLYACVLVGIAPVAILFFALQKDMAAVGEPRRE
jgi:ABC-type glycerol-3-phosphate transport system permease component